MATFLQRRRFSVKVNNVKSDVKIQENGIPQNSILSFTFFVIKINSIITNIRPENRLSASLHVDDFQIGYRHSELAVIESKLQVLVTQARLGLAWLHRSDVKLSESVASLDIRGT